ncbi:hypothetical protein PALA111701_18185 [Paenibacillus lactis]
MVHAFYVMHFVSAASMMMIAAGSGNPLPGSSGSFSIYAIVSRSSLKYPSYGIYPEWLTPIKQASENPPTTTLKQISTYHKLTNMDGALHSEIKDSSKKKAKSPRLPSYACRKLCILCIIHTVNLPLRKAARKLRTIPENFLSCAGSHPNACLYPRSFQPASGLSQTESLGPQL